jgi:hypothetical protein
MSPVTGRLAQRGKNKEHNPAGDDDPLAVSGPVLLMMKQMLGSYAAMNEFRDRMNDIGTTKGKVEHLRSLAHDEYPLFTGVLDEPIKKFFSGKKANKSLPAVDLATGGALYCSQFAFRYRPPFLQGTLKWFPTDAILSDARECLQYMAEEKSFLFSDKTGQAVFAGDKVELIDLPRYEFNGREAVVSRRDSKYQGRFTVKLDNQSFRLKPANMIKIDSPENHPPLSLEETQQRNLSALGGDKNLLNELLERCTKVDVLNKETWNRIEYINAKCALVTCMHLLNDLEESSHGWKNVLEIASRLLVRGGYLLQYDECLDEYGNIPVMQDYIASKSLWLQLSNQAVGTQTVLLLWKRT